MNSDLYREAAACIAADAHGKYGSSEYFPLMRLLTIQIEIYHTAPLLVAGCLGLEQFLRFGYTFLRPKARHRATDRSGFLSMDLFWNDFCARLEVKIGDRDMDAWVRSGLEVSALLPSVSDVRRVVFRTASRWHHDWIAENLHAEIAGACAEVLGRTVSVELLGDSAAAPAANGHPPRARIPSVDRSLVFENFVVGRCNEFAHAAAIAVVETPAHIYNPLFIYGSTGLGKTHLSHAIGNRVEQLHPHLNVCYYGAQQFFEQMVRAIQNQANLQFQERFRTEVDLLILDDIQFIEGRERTEEELFHIFEAMKANGKQIVITSDEPPRNLGKLAPRLRTRFEQGLLVDVQPPDVETMMAILARKAQAMRLDIPTDVQYTIAQRVRSSVRELEGVLKRLSALHAFYRTPITLPFLHERMSDLIPPPAPAPTPERIINRVADHYHLRSSDILGNRRPANIAWPRQVAMYLTRVITGLSFPEIGRAFSRDNSTVQYACNRVEESAERDPNIRAEIELLDRLCRAPLA
ncbi:MAG: chromosomal replication initiator protein DnaA [Myxococcales bacterium]|nr:chromosomal replication initiator protein DnaA [Myxococcales bacterium]